VKPWKFLILLGFLVIGQSLLANPIIVASRRGGPSDLVLWKQALIVLVSLAFECLALVILLRSAINARISSILKAFFLVHLISYPVTLLLVKPLGLTAEVFPLAFEPWFFALVSGLAVRDSWKSVFRSNLLSFLLGLAIPHIWVRVFPFWVGGLNAS
jgi:hypothetical protein